MFPRCLRHRRKSDSQRPENYPLPPPDRPRNFPGRRPAGQHQQARARAQARAAKPGREAILAQQIPPEGDTAATHQDRRPNGQVPGPEESAGGQDHQEVRDGWPIRQLPMGHLKQNREQQRTKGEKNNVLVRSMAQRSFYHFTGGGFWQGLSRIPFALSSQVCKMKERSECCRSRRARKDDL